MTAQGFYRPIDVWDALRLQEWLPEANHVARVARLGPEFIEPGVESKPPTAATIKEALIRWQDAIDDYWDEQAEEDEFDDLHWLRMNTEYWGA